MELITPLYECHKASGGKIVPFAGYLLPVQYPTGIITEHMAVRRQAGLFDVSHMGEVLYTGPDALANLQKLLTNDFTNMRASQVRYSIMCYENGGTVDDLIVYKMDDTAYMAVINAANRHKDVSWMREHLFGDVKFEDISDNIAQLALQGPNSQQILTKLASISELPEKYFSFAPEILIGGIKCLVSKTGYTGESGYEIYLSNEDAPKLWNMLLDAGADEGLIPCGLGARDTLRLEASMPLYGHELSETITPIEAGLGFAVKFSKEDFIGKRALLEAGAPIHRRVGLKITGRGIAREHQDVYSNESLIGYTTSGTHCPYIGAAMAMAMVDSDHSQIGKIVEVDVRGRRISAEVVALPFYKRV